MNRDVEAGREHLDMRIYAAEMDLRGTRRSRERELLCCEEIQRWQSVSLIISITRNVRTYTENRPRHFPCHRCDKISVHRDGVRRASR